MARLTVLLPCYNEELALPGLLTRLIQVRSTLTPAWDLNVLVMDDGSHDGTAAVARQDRETLPVTLVQHEINRGLGFALSTGVDWFLEHSGDDGEVLAVMDADLTHPPELLTEMLAKLGQNGSSIVIASRYAPGAEEHGLSAPRRGMSKLVSVGFSLLARVRGARDYSCAYRLYRHETLARAHEYYGDALITEHGFTCMAELLIKLGRRGATVAEVPLRLHYELKCGASKMKVAATIWRYVVLAWHVLFNPRWR
jgi:dolichol-phosphate mannosyltransferase